MPSLPRLSVLAVIGLCVGCSAHVPPSAVSPTTPPSLPVDPVAARVGHTAEIPLSPDPSAEVVARADREFVDGQQNLAVGHLVAAREAFDRAVDTLLTAPGGARSTPDLSADLDRLLDRITALEAQALHDGDGHHGGAIDAGGDRLLLSAGIEPPKPEATTEEDGHDDHELTAAPSICPIPLNTPGPVVEITSCWQGTLHDVMQDAPRPQRALRPDE